jgi:hypothetical protein
MIIKKNQIFWPAPDTKVVGLRSADLVKTSHKFIALDRWSRESNDGLIAIAERLGGSAAGDTATNVLVGGPGVSPRTSGRRPIGPGGAD